MHPFASSGTRLIGARLRLQHPQFDRVLDSLRLQKRGTSGEHTDVVDDTWDISNTERLGKSEVRPPPRPPQRNDHPLPSASHDATGHIRLHSTRLYDRHLPCVWFSFPPPPLPSRHPCVAVAACAVAPSAARWSWCKPWWTESICSSSWRNGSRRGRRSTI